MFLKFIVFEIKIDKHRMENGVALCMYICVCARSMTSNTTCVSNTTYNILAVNEYMDAVALMYRMYTFGVHLVLIS